MTRQRMTIAEVAIRVRDLDVSRAFYEREFGFTFHHAMQDLVFLEVGGLDTPLGEIGHPQLLALFNRDPDVETARSTFDHIAFEVPPEVYDAERARFAERDLILRERHWPDSLPWRGRSFFFHDPDGNVVEIITALTDDHQA